MRALEDGGGIFLFAAVVYLATMIGEYTRSTLYHAFTNDRAKRVFKVLDHSCIYLFLSLIHISLGKVLLERAQRLLDVGQAFLRLIGGQVRATFSWAHVPAQGAGRRSDPAKSVASIIRLLAGNAHLIPWEIQAWHQ